MQKPSATPSWTRHPFYRAEHTRTTWKLRPGLLTLVVVPLWLIIAWRAEAIARSPVYDTGLAPSNAISVERIDSDCALFECVIQSRRAGLGVRALDSFATRPSPQESSGTGVCTARAMAKFSLSRSTEIVPAREVEPIALNSCSAVQRLLAREHIRSVILMTPRSRVGGRRLSTAPRTAGPASRSGSRSPKGGGGCRYHDDGRETNR